MTVQRQIDQLISHRASEWVDILRTGGPAEHEAFVDWLRESRRHVAEFLAMVALDRELSQAVFKDLVDRDALLRRVVPGVTGLSRQAEHAPMAPVASIPGSLRRRYWKMALAAGIATIALAWAAVHNDFWTRNDFVTANRQQQAVELPDGSVMLLNANSRVQTNFTRSARDLELLDGEVLFKVARDPQRPFRVRTHDALIEALGTQFNVSAQSSGTEVAVLEGKIQVSPQGRDVPQDSGVAHQTLISGEIVRVGMDKSIERRAEANVEKIAEWRQRRLTFRGTSIGDIVREFNRHNATPKLRLEALEEDSRHYSAVFDADDPGSFVDFLNREQDVITERRGEEFVIRER